MPTNPSACIPKEERLLPQGHNPLHLCASQTTGLRKKTLEASRKPSRTLRVLIWSPDPSTQTLTRETYGTCHTPPSLPLPWWEAWQQLTDSSPRPTYFRRAGFVESMDRSLSVFREAAGRNPRSLLVWGMFTHSAPCWSILHWPITLGKNKITSPIHWHQGYHLCREMKIHLECDFCGGEENWQNGSLQT